MIYGWLFFFLSPHGSQVLIYQTQEACEAAVKDYLPRTAVCAKIRFEPRERAPHE